jgi:recA bacterial DNA recombination protein
MTRLSLVRSYVESRLPGALSPLMRSAPEMIRTGIEGLDRLTGGIPRRGLTQICAPREVSSGRTTVLVSMMAEVTRAEEFCALVDASDCFDPASAEAAGVDMSRVLWVRGERRRGIKPLPPQPAQKTRGPWTPLEQAFKATDIIVQNGGFGLIAVDLGNIEERWVRKAPLSTWFRFARVMEKMPAALVFLLSYPAAQSCAALTVHLAGSRGRWHGAGEVFHANFLSGVECEFEIGRARTRKPVQPVPGRFTASPVWA